MSPKPLVTKKSRAELLGVCLEITRVLDDLEPRARLLCMTPQHASLQARLVLVLCRLNAGDSGVRLVLEMNRFVHAYNAHVEVLAR